MLYNLQINHYGSLTDSIFELDIVYLDYALRILFQITWHPHFWTESVAIESAITPPAPGFK